MITFDVSDFQLEQEFAGLDTIDFTCSLDGHDPATCTSPVRYLGLDVGAHQVVIKATNRETQATGSVRYGWTIVAGVAEKNLTNRASSLAPVDVGRLQAPAAAPNVQTSPMPAAVPPTEQSNDVQDTGTLSNTGARTIELAALGAMLIAAGLLLARASVFRRRSA